MRNVLAAPDLLLSSPSPTAESRNSSHWQVGPTHQLRHLPLAPVGRRAPPLPLLFAPRAAGPWPPAYAAAAGPAPRQGRELWRRLSQGALHGARGGGRGHAHHRRGRAALPPPWLDEAAAAVVPLDQALLELEHERVSLSLRAFREARI